MARQPLINFRAPQADLDRWRVACSKNGVSVSEVCRDALEALAKEAGEKPADE